MDIKKERGLIIAKTSRIEHTDEGWKVPSQSGQGYYNVSVNGYGGTCTCPDYELREVKCKHQWAVEYLVTGAIDDIGDITPRKAKKTYKQNWSAYDKASINQKMLFMKFLNDLTSHMPKQTQRMGRPTLPIGDMIYSSILKVFTTFSLRRFMGDIEIALDSGYISKKPCYSSIGHFMQREDITPILAELVTMTSLPLKTVEKYFGIDSTGFGTTSFQRWFSFKHGRDIDRRRWVKCHFVNGAQSNIITSVKITSQFEGDSPQLKELVDKTAKNFNMDAVCGDKAYSSRKNLETIDGHGATPYIPFTSNVSGKARGSSVWKKMFHYFQLHQDIFLAHYHTRSNAESTVQMIKSKFGDKVRSKTWTAQVNEVLCKIICHNICVVIQEMYELGIDPNFMD